MFKNKIVCITGGSRGIGRAIVADFSQKGATVYFTYHLHEEAAQETQKQFGACKIKCAQSDQVEIEKTVELLCERHGTIDILVNNAGITADQYVMMMPVDEWMRVMDTNVNGAFRWAKAVSRPMLSAGNGAIINIASISGLMGIGGQTNYAASKGALIAFTRSLAAELGPKGIRVNAVVPGFIDTDMTAKMPRQIKLQNKDRILLKRFGTPQEVADVVSFLASEKSSYIVGQTIIVDGGLSSTVP
jgi:Dehydrogenases with different specificities (related to short-chain alcohol dehydrogenases)